MGGCLSQEARPSQPSGNQPSTLNKSEGKAPSCNEATSTAPEAIHVQLDSTSIATTLHDKGLHVPSQQPPIPSSTQQSKDSAQQEQPLGSSKSVLSPVALSTGGDHAEGPAVNDDVLEQHGTAQQADASLEVESAAGAAGRQTRPQAAAGGTAHKVWWGDRVEVSVQSAPVLHAQPEGWLTTPDIRAEEPSPQQEDGDAGASDQQEAAATDGQQEAAAAAPKRRPVTRSVSSGRLLQHPSRFGIEASQQEIADAEAEALAQARAVCADLGQPLPRTPSGTRRRVKRAATERSLHQRAVLSAQHQQLLSNASNFGWPGM